MIYKLLERIDDSVDTSSLRTVHYASSPMAPERIEQCLMRFGQVFVQSYGSTEAMGGMTMLDRSDHIPGAPQLASCGRESVTGEVRVGDDAGRFFPPAEIGEILARGPSLFARYWNQEDATRAAFTPDGWFRSGDIGRTDQDGFIYLLDRKNDKIISGGINIYPNEIEHALYSHPAVDEAVVFGVPDPTWGEAVTAVVRLRIGAAARSEELRDWVRDRLAAYQVPKRVDFVTEELPKGATGKMLRRAVREKYWAGHDRQIG
jgi:acyl-CoA synthetase (AMP-forming)/AMP-acid ligase II